MLCCFSFCLQPQHSLLFFLQHGVLSKEFVELMGHCNTTQAEYRDRNVERIQRQLKISECVIIVLVECGDCESFSLVTSHYLFFYFHLSLVLFFSLAGNNVTDEELDTMLESGQTDVFTQNVSACTGKVVCVVACVLETTTQNIFCDKHLQVFL